MTDWNLIIEGNLSLLWIQETLNPINKNKTIDEVLKEFKVRNKNIDPLNVGTLFMATYLLFLYPRESEFKNIDINSIDISGFEIKIQGSKPNNESDNEYLIRRIRNSIAHGNFTIEHNLIIRFEDNNMQNSNPFVTEILLSKFGSFINDFMFTVKEQTLNIK